MDFIPLNQTHTRHQAHPGADELGPLGRDHLGLRHRHHRCHLRQWHGCACNDSACRHWRADGNRLDDECLDERRAVDRLSVDDPALSSGCCARALGIL